jgi:hypothetical protein
MKNEPNNTHVPYTAIKTGSKTSCSLLVSPGVATLAKQSAAKESKAKQSKAKQSKAKQSKVVDVPTDISI